MEGGSRVVLHRHLRISLDLPGRLQHFLRGEPPSCSTGEVASHLYCLLPASCVHHLDRFVCRRTRLAWICAAEVATTLWASPGNHHPRYIARLMAFARV